ncbi:hypothetical protein Dimus_024209 [Dionaea muscipula]
MSESMMSMGCLSCKKYLYYRASGSYYPTIGTFISGPCWTSSEGFYTTNGPGNCMECYVEARDTAVELKREIEKLERENKELERKNEELKANFGLWASRSLVFKAMIETALEETIRKTMSINDVNYDFLPVFTNRLYTGGVCLDEKIARKLLVLAEKYQVKHLKEHCERYLVSNLNWDNLLSNYVFAYQHNVGKLLEASLSIIYDNMDKFMNMDEYGELVKMDHASVVGIFEAYMKKRSS